MTALAKYLARDLEVLRENKVVSIKEDDEAWTLKTEAGKTFSGDTVVLTMPVPQSLQLLKTCNRSLPESDLNALSRIEYDPAIAVLALMTQSSNVPEPGGVRFTEGPIAFVADNHQKGISPDATAITIHIDSQYSRDHWEDSDDAIADFALGQVREWVDPGHVKTVQVKRWKYSVPIVLYPHSCMEAFSDPKLVLAGDGFGGPRIEGAVVSGIAAAERILGKPVRIEG